MAAMNRTERIIGWLVLAFWAGYVASQVITHKPLTLELVIASLLVGTVAGQLREHYRLRLRFLKAHREGRVTVIDE